MPHLIDHVDDATQLAHCEFIARLAEFAADNGWEVLRHVDTGGRELILRGAGYTGTEEIFIGMKTYESVEADYYNLAVATFTGYVAGNSFETQPGAMVMGVPCHNQRVDFWLSVNPQRIACAMKVGTPVYESFYLGKMLPYARPSQYPYPMVCAGMLPSASATRYSDTAHDLPYKGKRANLKLRTNDGYVQPYAYPWQNRRLCGVGIITDPSGGLVNTHLRDTGDQYPLLPVELNDNANNLWGALDGVYFVPGFNVVVEDTITIDGVDYVVIEDVWRTGFADYYALRLDQ
ncbi:MAG: hypothetical protein LBF93_10725 [Zoogloeaceae bacterium]|jgi:hypothetical protein|nr:hypothetical protein [Zoogloeaceae bacterium]